MLFLVAADQLHSLGVRTRLGRQFRAPLRVMFGHHERQTQPTWRTFSPALHPLRKELFS